MSQGQTDGQTDGRLSVASKVWHQLSVLGSETVVLQQDRSQTGLGLGLGLTLLVLLLTLYVPTRRCMT